MSESAREVELTENLLKFAKSVALKEAQNICPKSVAYDDVAQLALIDLVRRPPKYDPTKGASLKTFIYTCVRRGVLKHAPRETARHQELPMVVKAAQGEHERTAGARGYRGHAGERRPLNRAAPQLTLDDILRFIDCPESRALCRLYVECDCNTSEVARRLRVVEGTVRNRLKMLAPKLIAAGFYPFRRGGKR